MYLNEIANFETIKMWLRTQRVPKKFLMTIFFLYIGIKNINMAYFNTILKNTKILIIENAPMQYLVYSLGSLKII